jgi:hypothetical protein
MLQPMEEEAMSEHGHRCQHHSSWTDSANLPSLLEEDSQID